MVHEGNKVRQLSRLKGFKQVELAAMRGVTKQTINTDFSRERLGMDTLKWYSNVLGVNIEELLKSDNNQTEVSEDNYKKKYFELKEKHFELLEETKKLWQVVSQNGIKVDLGKFDVISLPRVSSLYFFAHANTTDNNYGF